jgi:hypothetical protein
MDSGGAPQGVHRGYLSDEGGDLGVDRWTAHPRPAGARGPVLAEAAPLPPEDGVGGRDDQSLPPAGPDSGQPNPQEAIHRAQSGPRHRSFVHGELLAQGEVLESELAMAAAEERAESKQTFSGSCQAIFLGRCRSCCRAIVAKWYCSSYGTWRSHRTKMIFTHFAPNARSAS